MRLCAYAALTPDGDGDSDWNGICPLCIAFKGDLYSTFENCVTLEHKTVLSRWCIDVAIAKNTLYVSKFLIFFYATNHQDIK